MDKAETIKILKNLYGLRGLNSGENQAIKIAIEALSVPLVIGVDPAREGGDLSVQPQPSEVGLISQKDLEEIQSIAEKNIFAKAKVGFSNMELVEEIAKDIAREVLSQGWRKGE